MIYTHTIQNLQKQGFRCQQGSWGQDYPNHAWLITPARLDCKWTNDNLIFRSAIVDPTSMPWKFLSLGFPKFFNYNEASHLYPAPEQFNDWIITEKIDGTLVIVDWVDNFIHMRTRNTFCYKTQPNAKDFELLLELYPHLKNFFQKYPNVSMLIELTTPRNTIVIHFDQIQFTLLGIIDRLTLQLWSFERLQQIQKQFSLPPLPITYKFSSLKQAVDSVSIWKKREGIVISYNNNQNRIKIKSLWYLQQHYLYSSFNPSFFFKRILLTQSAFSLKEIIDLAKKWSNKKTIEQYMQITFNLDWEIIHTQRFQRQIHQIAQIFQLLHSYLLHLQTAAQIIQKNPLLETRAQRALYIQKHYTKIDATIIFHFLTLKKISKSFIMQLIKEFLAKKDVQTTNVDPNDVQKQHLANAD